MGVFEHYQERFDATQQEELSLKEYLELCKTDTSTYATAAERLLLSIGEPEFVDTAKDPRLSRVFSNKIIKRYPESSRVHRRLVSLSQAAMADSPSC